MTSRNSSKSNDACPPNGSLTNFVGDRAQAAAAVWRQRLFAAGIASLRLFRIRQVVIGVDAVDEDHAGFGVVVGGPHDLVEQFACPGLANIQVPSLRRSCRTHQRLGRVARFDSPSLSTARMNAAVIVTDMLKLPARRGPWRG